MPNTTPPPKTLLPQQFYIGLTAITIICVQFINLLMSVEPSGYSGSGTKANWNDKETDALLDHLIKNKTLGQGHGNFKDQVYTSASEAISDLLSSGPVKTSKHCKTKWATVSVTVIFPYHCSLIIDQQLKTIYTAIEDFRTNVSGAHWDVDTGATIEGPAAEKVWSDIVSARVRYYFFALISSDIISPTIVSHETLQRSRLAVL